MSAVDYLISIGVNTGNSLDAADVVLTKFGSDGSIVDLDALSKPMPSHLADQLRSFRNFAVDSDGDMDLVMRDFPQGKASEIIREYTLYVAEAVNELLKRTANRGVKADVVGFHGQTCAHQPPSITSNPELAYTLQIGDGQLLSDSTGITVIYDFRSDDLINGGEAAPLAPAHHQHLAAHLKARGKFPIAFCNAGNTGNLTVISEDKKKTVKLLGWDVGPFNDYPDKLMQKQKGQACDVDGLLGARGRVNEQLLKVLFDRGAVTESGANFLLQPPPKSSDPQWYRLLPELLGEAPVQGSLLAFEDRLRTAEYFSAYVYFYSLKWIPAEVAIPRVFALCGGGWNNPICRSSFETLLKGQFSDAPVLPEHREIFTAISKRLNEGGAGQIEVKFADEYGFSGQYMEARLFADAAVARAMGQPFSWPETSGCKTPTVLGIVRYPDKKRELASENLKRWFARYKSSDLTLDKPELFDGRWSRASRGWKTRAHSGVVS
jgi:anhydro-N-acetylmuramic acid kinase